MNLSFLLLALLGSSSVLGLPEKKGNLRVRSLLQQRRQLMNCKGSRRNNKWCRDRRAADVPDSMDDEDIPADTKAVLEKQQEDETEVVNKPTKKKTSRSQATSRSDSDEDADMDTMADIYDAEKKKEEKKKKRLKKKQEREAAITRKAYNSHYDGRKLPSFLMADEIELTDYIIPALKKKLQKTKDPAKKALLKNQLKSSKLKVAKIQKLEVDREEYANANPLGAVKGGMEFDMKIKLNRLKKAVQNNDEKDMDRLGYGNVKGAQNEVESYTRLLRKFKEQKIAIKQKARDDKFNENADTYWKKKNKWNAGANLNRFKKSMGGIFSKDTGNP